MSNITVKFYPIGNADCSLIKTQDDKFIIIDYAAPSDGSFDLAKGLKNEVGEGGQIEILSFSHMDADHVKGASDLFYLEHAEKYQTEGRIKIKELWVPAAAIVESGLEDDARVIRQEARYRLKNKNGVKVFGKPEYLKEYLESDESGKDINYDDVKHLIVEAGSNIPMCGLEFFIHAPFSNDQDDKSTIKRNSNALAFQIRVTNGSRISNLLYLGDLDSDIISKIVSISECKGNVDRLRWDILKVAHHGSYTALNKDDKDKKKTIPTDEIKRLLEHGSKGAKILISSQSIDKNDYDRTQPPHIQAYNSYKEYADKNSQRILVTGDSDESISLILNEYGVREELKLPKSLYGAAAVTAPRVG